MKFHVHTFGCKVNTYDSGLLQKNFLSQHPQSMLVSSQEAQVHILNTCAVTAEASKEATRLARRIKSKNPNAMVVVTGCAAQVDSEMFKDLPAVDLIVANSHKSSLPFLVDQALKGSQSQKLFRSNIFRKDEFEPGGGLEESHTRAFLKIQDGCNSFCTFCIIPFARGRSRSLGILDLVQRVNELHQRGILEVVLTGVHIGDYSDPQTGFGLEDLVEQILRRSQIPRIRLTSLEPIELSPRLLDLFQDPRMMPHFHLSIQSADDAVLKGMKRKYGRAEVVDAFQRIAKFLPHAFVGMDVIAGFPSETEDQFLNTWKTLQDNPWSRMHVFPYSERKGTKALHLDPVPLSVRHARARRLRELSAQRFFQTLQNQVNTEKEMLILGDGRQSLSRDYFSMSSEQVLPVGSLRKMKVIGVNFAKGILHGLPS